MIDPVDEPQEDFNQTREHEYQDAHYHDEDAEIVNDEFGRQPSRAAGARKKTSRIPPPRPRHYEE